MKRLVSTGVANLHRCGVSAIVGAAALLLLSNSVGEAGTFEAKLTASDAAAGDSFGGVSTMIIYLTQGKNPGILPT